MTPEEQAARWVRVDSDDHKQLAAMGWTVGGDTGYGRYLMMPPGTRPRVNRESAFDRRERERGQA